MTLHKNHTPHVHLNLNVRGLTVSATLAIQELCNQIQKEGRQVFKLGLGQSPFPVPKPVVNALKDNAFQKDYLPVKGLRQLRETVAEYHRKCQHIPSTYEDVLIGPGSKGLMFILQMVYYGNLIIPTPSWVSYAPQAQIIGRQVQWVRTREEDGWRITPEELDKICSSDPDRPRLVVLNYPNNPTGHTYKTEELKALAKVAGKYRIILLSDEIYGELHHTGKHVSIARFYPEGTIISGGLSKWCGAGGWRLGVFTFPHTLRWLQDAMAVVASESYTSTSAPIQYAAVRAFQGGMDIERYLWQVRRILRTMARFILHHLEECGVSLPHPQGAFYIFPDFQAFKERLASRGIKTSEEMCRRLLQDTGVAMLPGSAFGSPEEELTARIAYVDFDGAKALAAAERISQEETLDDEFLHAYCGNVTTAIDRLCEWLKA